jgi:hypothetical protein
MTGTCGQLRESKFLPPHRCPSYLEVRDLVILAQCDLEYIHGADESCQPCQTLLTTPTYTNQQSISPWGLQDATDMAAREGSQGTMP